MFKDTPFGQWLLQEKHREQLRKTQAELCRAFTEHPRESGETYLQHLKFTTTVSVRFFLCGLVLCVHGLLPFIFKRTASRQTEALNVIMKKRAAAQPQEFDPESKAA